MKLNIQDKFNKVLPADTVSKNVRRQVDGACLSYVTPKKPSKPSLIHASEEVAGLIGLSPLDINSQDFIDVFSGERILEGTQPYSMCYGGHQFGHWAGQLGDGRAINLAEVAHNNKSWALQLKGAGETPYSRSADGLAVLRSSIREHLCSEAMFYLGVPTTRSLSLISTGDQVLRDVLYDGNPAYEKGAVVCRVAPSFVRFGNFEIFASKKDTEILQKLTDYVIANFFQEINNKGTKAAYLRFFQTVVSQTLDMVIHWQRVGFVHGVMNTDNMSVLGLTIDYGPYGWLESYDAHWTPNTTDLRERRYRFGNQPQIALWNLYQLANALYPLIKETHELEEILNAYRSEFEIKHLEMMRAKLGLKESHEKDEELIKDLEKALHLTEIDMTIFFRLLSNLNTDESSLEFSDVFEDALYDPSKFKGETQRQWTEWLKSYRNRIRQEKVSQFERHKAMKEVNPKYVLRNYMAQLAIDDANQGDYHLIAQLHELLKNPYAEQPENEKWFAKRPDWARNKVGCSMLSCSS